MASLNIGLIVIVGSLALALIVFLAVRNQKDKKKIMPPEAIDDAVEQTRTDQQREQDKS